MPKVKMARHSTHVDMTAMCDVAFLLLTFFMLATKFKPDEPVVVKTPSSISSMTLPDTSIMLITVDPKGRTFFSIDKKNIALYNNESSRKILIDRMNDDKGLKLTAEEKQKFISGASVGVPLNQLGAYLDDPQKFAASATGIPVDTNAQAADNELATWINEARLSNPFIRICIKADSDTPYPNYSRVIATLSGLKIFTFNLITNLEGIPQGTAAYEDAQKGGKI